MARSISNVAFAVLALSVSLFAASAVGQAQVPSAQVKLVCLAWKDTCQLPWASGLCLVVTLHGSNMPWTHLFYRNI